MYRTGLGFDIHKFSKKKKDLILGGIKIPSTFGLEAVSDGDVVLHAISDGLCGACGLGDIGDYFPPSSGKSKEIKSEKIAKFILKKIERKYKVFNIDITIIAEKPVLSPYKKDILDSLKRLFSLSEINLKIKSKEGLNILGGRNAVACFAIVLVEKC
ncbi:MAG: 2-C-methyl-D-erythritol 2,4-cyclodiphosphate synthase [Candidatus Omnitrophica bacterium]|nr:2-C-methyl-D-erythritol 2,4-cyclodiphosphate synthase [Candidatus Omnitrophota bacterium]